MNSSSKKQCGVQANNASVGLGDAVRISYNNPYIPAEYIAELLGYEFREVKERTGIRGVLPIAFDLGEHEPEHVPDLDALFWWVSARENLKAQESKDKPPPKPDSVPTTLPELPISPLPDLDPLMAWSSLWPFLKGVLSMDQPSKQVDAFKAADHIAACKPLDSLPLKRRRTWTQSVRIILDTSLRFNPFRRDVNWLVDNLLGMLGKGRARIYEVKHDPNDPMYEEARCGEFQFRPDPNGGPVLILSDLGLYGEKGVRKAWLAFGRALKRKGARPVVLSPTPPDMWSDDLCKVYRMACWDRDSVLPRIHGVEGKGSAPGAAKDRTKDVETLLGLLSPAIRVEPGLLRAMRRRLLPGTDVGVEGLAWNHEVIRRHYLAFSFATEKQQELLAAFGQDISEEDQQRAQEVIEEYHAFLPAVIRLEEGLNLAHVQDKPLSKELVEYLEWLEQCLSDELPVDKESREFLSAWVKRMAKRQLEEIPGRPECRAIKYAYARAIQLEKEHKSAWKPSWHDESILGEVDGVLPKDQVWELRQVGESLYFLKPDSLAGGSLVATIRSKSDLETSEFKPKLTLAHGLSIPLPCKGELTLKTYHEQMIMAAMPKPKWAEAIGRDQYGLYADIDINGVTQRMRYIVPGTFLMGSPETEAHRLNDEQLHEVTLTKSFWFADTACTQELWAAVMGDNPSRFKDADVLPVENVSWKNCNAFLKKVNKTYKGLDLRLPTEAQWEYACRAGRDTPFSFGENITTDQVNYDGNYPYDHGPIGEYRKKTVPVKELPSNQWGLYQMHGNVWEWCADWYGEYSVEEKQNPTGPRTGEVRVLRGGSWIDVGSYVRSACRIRRVPGYRFDYFGFRFSRGL